ncbi:hypothetical protein EVAR_31008_1 [Eumeta japonica]|uniref:Uncharacterized protein n=1 Tax=Eumeta variegata TaxID=151549 RepID=A0A4C1VEN1_EUMVA|nr:hypothetical protein EVAR_31008_1 [Eumeta japonica]
MGLQKTGRRTMCVCILENDRRLSKQLIADVPSVVRLGFAITRGIVVISGFDDATAEALRALPECSYFRLRDLEFKNLHAGPISPTTTTTQQGY